MNPNAVEANGAITASSSAKYLRIICHVGAAAGVEEVEIGKKNSTSRNPKGRTAVPTIANREIRLSWGSSIGGNEVLISENP